MNRIGIIGPGLLGGAIASLLKERGFEIAGIYGRRKDAAERLAKEVGSEAVAEPDRLLYTADIILVCVSDSAISEIADRLAERAGMDGRRPRSRYIFHFSGALPSSVLLGAKRPGMGIGSIHPLQSFADRDTALRMIPASLFTLEGEREALNAARSLLSALGVDRIVEICAEDKALYHAAAAIAGNYLVLLGGIAADILKSIGIPEEEGLCGIGALMEGTLANLRAAGLSGSLTGPISRGDAGTVAGHIEALKEWKLDIARLYTEMGRLLLPIAERKGSIPLEKRDEMIRLFNI